MIFGPRPINVYVYIDDTGHSHMIRVSARLAEAVNLPPLPAGNPDRLIPMGRGWHPRHIHVVGLEERPGQHKYRAKLITNERDPSKLLGKIINVDGRQMRCTRYVGEQRTARH